MFSARYLISYIYLYRLLNLINNVNPLTLPIFDVVAYKEFKESALATG